PRVGIRRLVSAKFLVRHPDGRFGFRSGLLRDAIMKPIDETSRDRVHHAAVRFYRRHSAAPPKERLPRLAYHAERAGFLDEAKTLYASLAEMSRHRHAYLEAEALYSRAIHLVSAGEHRAKLALVNGRGLMRYRVGRYRDALDDFAEGLEIAETLSDTAH